MRALAELTYVEAKAALDRGAVGLWPIGSTEAHGPHLPLSTDAIIAEETCRRAAPLIAARFGLEAFGLPTLAFTVTEFAAPFSGTISVPRNTALAYVRDVLIGAARTGFRALALVNAHLEPAHRYMLREAVAAARAATGVAIALADPSDRRFAGTLTEEFQRGACHAGRYETSLVLAAAVGAVREPERAALSPLEIDLLERIKAGATTFPAAGADRAYFGDPAAATRTEGDETYGRLAEIVCRVIFEALDPAGANV